MCTKIPNNQLEERLRWVLPVIDKEISIKQLAKVCPPFSEWTVKYWLTKYRGLEIVGLENKLCAQKL